MPSSRSRLSDIEQGMLRLPEDEIFQGSEDVALLELEVEDPMGEGHRQTEFEPFSKAEWAFIALSCVVVVSMPLVYLMVTG
jgi:hypothetical protein